MKVYLLTEASEEDVHDLDVDMALDYGAPYATLRQAQTAAQDDFDDWHEGDFVDQLALGDVATKLVWHEVKEDGKRLTRSWGADNSGLYGQDEEPSRYWRIREFTI